jgi:hypothetical protein
MKHRTTWKFALGCAHSGRHVSRGAHRERVGTAGAHGDPMTEPKRSAPGSIAPAQVTSYIREHLADDVEIPADPMSSLTALVASVDETSEFLERWIARHFSMSVRLHDVRRELSSAGAADPADEVEAVVTDLDVVQGVLIELHEYATSEERVRDLMQTSRVLQHGVVAVYTWLGEVLSALQARSISRRRPSFVDEEGAPAMAMINTLERLHPDLERLVRADEVPADADVTAKIALCFRQIGAAIVRISGRSTTRPPPG